MHKTIFTQVSVTSKTPITQPNSNHYVQNRYQFTLKHALLHSKIITLFHKGTSARTEPSLCSPIVQHSLQPPARCHFACAIVARSCRTFVQNEHGAHQLTRFYRSFNALQAPLASTDQGSCGAIAQADNVRSLSPPNHCRLMLP